MTLRILALGIIAVALMQSQCLTPCQAQGEATNTIRVEQAVRRVTGGRIALRTYATIVIPPNTLQKDVTVIATLDLDRSVLTVTTAVEMSLSGRVSVEINFDRFPGGLAVQFVPAVKRASVVRFIGLLADVDPDNQTISVDGESDLKKFTIPQGTPIMRGDSDQSSRPVRLADLGVGDQITATLAADGRTVEGIESRYRAEAGVVRTVTARRIVLEPNQAFNVNQNVLVTSARDEELEMADLRIGQRVSMRLNPVSREVWEISLGRLRGVQVEPAPPSTGTSAPADPSLIPAPKITSPKEGAVSTDSVVIKGTTLANARVTIAVQFVRRGVILTRGTLPDQEVKANAQGGFESAAIPIRKPRLLEESVDYTITVIAIRPDGKKSAEAILKLTRK